VLFARRFQTPLGFAAFWQRPSLCVEIEGFPHHP
jgi:hypothetical protein